MTRLATREAVKARQDEVQRRGRGLGWMSLGLGVAQLAAPDTVRRISGVDDSPTSRTVVPRWSQWSQWFGLRRSKRSPAGCRRRRYEVSWSFSLFSGE